MSIALAPTALLLASVLMVQDGTPRVLSEPPGRGQLRTGERVLVDDRSCPAGQIREITGGSNSGQRGGVGTGVPDQGRQSRCIPRP